MIYHTMEQGSDEWLTYRSGKITGSEISNVLMAKSTAGYQTYMAKLICERLTGRPVETFKSAAMDHGTETEPQAIAFYELESGNDVCKIGFVDHPILSGAGCSPDGLIGDLGGVEIKCPQPAKHIKNLMGGTIDKAYMLQMQWFMECTGRAWCDFVSFNPSFPEHLKISVRRVEADTKLQGEIRAAVVAFLADVETKLEALEAMR